MAIRTAHDMCTRPVELVVCRASEDGNVVAMQILGTGWSWSLM